MIYLDKGLLTGRVPVIVCPAPDQWVELRNQVPGFGLCVAFDDLSDFSQEYFHILFRRLGDDLTVVVFAYLLSQKCPPGLGGV